MIPEHFKQDANFDIRVFGFPVNVDYRYHWLKPLSGESDPRVVHFEFRSDSHVISHTGYRSHFLLTGYLENCEQQSIAELATALGEHLARENGYEPPEPQSQLSLF